MKTIKYLTIAFLSIGMLIISGCKKGNDGPQGEDGNANVIGTNIITVNNWSQQGSVWRADLTVGEITKDVVDRGLVQIFKKYGPEWWALPDINGGTMTYFGYDVGYVSLMISNVDGSTPSFPNTTDFRVVVISPSNLAAHPDVDFSNYEELKSTFNLSVE